MKLTGNNHYALLMTWSAFGGQRSRSQQAVNVAKASTSTLGRRISSSSGSMSAFIMVGLVFSLPHLSDWLGRSLDWPIPMSSEMLSMHRSLVMLWSKRLMSMFCLQSADCAALQGLLPSETSSYSAYRQQCSETRLDSKRESVSTTIVTVKWFHAQKYKLHRCRLLIPVSANVLWLIIIIIIIEMIFMALSSWQSHCESSPGSFDECRLSAEVAANPQTKSTDLDCESARKKWQLPSTSTIAILLLLSPRAGTHFTVPRRVEGWVDLGTAVRVCSPCPRLYIAVAVVINNCPR